jgi:glycosyltransferase involved in cell wall biosynthesis
VLPKISIITPSFNQSNFIERTITSLLNQHYPNLEYIIIDGGSKDGSVEIIRKYENSLAYWISEPDNGQSDAINKGLKFATGDIINWLNSDDYLEQGALFEIAKEFQKNDIDLVCGYARLHFPEKKVLKRTSIPGKDFSKIIAAGHIMQPSTFFRKKIFDEFLPIQTSLHYMMDHYIWLRYLAKYGFDNIKYTDKVLVNVLMHADAKSVSQIFNFRKERNRIFASMFKSINYSPALKYLSENNPLSFPVVSVPVINNIEDIYFYFLQQQLFVRNYRGERLRINYKALRQLLLRFPAKFAHSLFQRVFNK